STEVRTLSLHDALPLSRSSGMHLNAPMIAITPIGAFIRNIHRHPHSGPSTWISAPPTTGPIAVATATVVASRANARALSWPRKRSEEHTSELQSRFDLV